MHAFFSSFVFLCLVAMENSSSRNDQEYEEQSINISATLQRKELLSYFRKHNCCLKRQLACSYSYSIIHMTLKHEKKIEDREWIIASQKIEMGRLMGWVGLDTKE